MTYVRNGKQVLFYDNDETPVQIADCADEEKADAIMQVLNKNQLDYVTQAATTLSNKFHGNLVGRAHFKKTLNDAIEALNQLDKVKKSIFYGRDNNIEPNEGAADISDMPGKLVEANIHIDGGFDVFDAENFIHGAIGLATEAGEILEALKNALNGEALDRVNIKEEVGDAKWYMAVLSMVARFPWGEDERVNIEKLRARFPDKFTEARAINRDLDKEREILERSKPLHERSAKMEGERNLDGDAIEAQNNLK